LQVIDELCKKISTNGSDIFPKAFLVIPILIKKNKRKGKISKKYFQLQKFSPLFESYKIN
jgi:hypothetical protein